MAKRSCSIESIHHKRRKLCWGPTGHGYKVSKADSGAVGKGYSVPRSKAWGITSNRKPG